jgi:hypothetical protein
MGDFLMIMIGYYALRGLYILINITKLLENAPASFQMRGLCQIPPHTPKWMLRTQVMILPEISSDAYGSRHRNNTFHSSECHSTAKCILLARRKLAAMTYGRE